MFFPRFSPFRAGERWPNLEEGEGGVLKNNQEQLALQVVSNEKLAGGTEPCNLVK